LLLVEEPTASRDPKTSRQIMRLIKSCVPGTQLSAIINIHDVMLAQMFAERIAIAAREIVYDGRQTIAPRGATKSTARRLVATIPRVTTKQRGRSR